MWFRWLSPYSLNHCWVVFAEIGMYEVLHLHLNDLCRIQFWTMTIQWSYHSSALNRQKIYTSSVLNPIVWKLSMQWQLANNIFVSCRINHSTAISVFAVNQLTQSWCCIWWIKTTCFYLLPIHHFAEFYAYSWAVSSPFSIYGLRNAILTIRERLSAALQSVPLITGSLRPIFPGYV